MYVKKYTQSSPLLHVLPVDTDVKQYFPFHKPQIPFFYFGTKGKDIYDRVELLILNLVHKV